ncbi:S1C family serine protease [Chelatococcus reniformis]|uniref:2-alkenal reductase n=1 Tax=Chelatococcus reniformis TaxID=1494448 RepID=A0A916XJL4_9HYPH|nr:trypsin-like peptidase domain-containing protein [Chelatococcus reniformis]GGC75206.1 2-alkenal reductase [Chelatococcus reniformis]
MSFFSTFLGRLVAVTLALLLLIAAWQSIPLIQSELLGWRAQPRQVTARGDLAEDEKSTVALFESRSGSVVFITTVQRGVNPWTGNPLRERAGTGSGFIWDDLGHVVTNYHVIEGATEALVSLADGRSFRAGLVGGSSEHDLAVLRIGVGVDRPPPLPIGTSSDLKVGQKVFAIGNPFGLDRTLTTGIISALNRSLPEESGRTLTGLIQTDAAINPGNSGGPLLDSAGRLIGVNTAIYSPSGASAGIGFAVPVDEVNRVVPRLIATGRYVGASLGVRIEPEINAALSERLGTEGVFVLDVEPGSAAERAGLRPARLSRDGGFQVGDVLVAIDGQTLRTPADLTRALDRLEAGVQAKLTLLRNGTRLHETIVLGASGRGAGGR